MSRAASQSQHVTKPAVISDKGLVTSQNRIASQIGAQVLNEGGNAVDAAIATSFALGVVEPWMSGIGGGGYMILRRAGDTQAQVVDFGMRAPKGLRCSDYPIIDGKAGDLFPWAMVQDDANIAGARAVAMPGQVAGMGAAHAAFGTKPWADLLAPAIAEAHNGLDIDWYAQLILTGAAKGLAACETTRAIYLDADGHAKTSAWTALGKPKCHFDLLAQTLGRIARDGPEAFYVGDLAQSMVADLQAAGGRHTIEDFANYRADIVAASEFDYKGHKIFSTPHMTAGPTLERVFALLAAQELSDSGPHPKDWAAYDAAIRQANAERFETMGDILNEPAPSCTTHINVVDAEGTMVSVTQTLLSVFGARLTLPGSGVLMNNGIMWFDPEPGKPNSIGPDKRCLANMCPTLLERRDGRRFGLGAAGGRKIMPAVAQLASYVLDFGMDIETAMHMPRIDCSLADVTIADAALEPGAKDALAQLIPELAFAPSTAYPFNFGCASLVSRQSDQNQGATEVTAHWADTVAADSAGQLTA